MVSRVTEYRANMRSRGYKEIRYWVPDVTSDTFAQRIQVEAAALNAADRMTEMADYLDAIQAETTAEP